MNKQAEIKESELSDYGDEDDDDDMNSETTEDLHAKKEARHFKPTMLANKGSMISDSSGYSQNGLYGNSKKKTEPKNKAK